MVDGCWFVLVVQFTIEKKIDMDILGSGFGGGWIGATGEGFGGR